MFKLDFTQEALAFYNRLHYVDRSLFARIDKALDALKENPYQGKALRHQFKGQYSLRVGNYRVIYTIKKEIVMVYVLDIGHRRDIYN